MLKKVVKMFVAALIVIGVKNSNVGAVEPIPRPTSVGTCRSLFELGTPQSTVGKSNLQIFKVLLNGGSIWKDIFLGFWSYSCDNVIRADKVSDREIFWDKDGNFNIYSLAYMDSGEVKRQHGVVGLLFYDKSSWKHDSGFSEKYDIIAVRLPDNINIDLGGAYFPGEEDFISEFVQKHMVTDSCMFFSNDKWIVFVTVDFYKSHPGLEKIDDFEKYFNRMLALLCNKKYESRSMQLFYKYNKLYKKRSLY